MSLYQNAVFVLLTVGLLGCMGASSTKKSPIAAHGQPSSSPLEAMGPASVDRHSTRRLAVTEDGFCIIGAAGEIVCRQMVLSATPTGVDKGAPAGEFAEIVGHRRGFCARRESGQVVCWQGQDQRLTEVPKFDGNYEEIVSSLGAVCARTKAGALDCLLPRPMLLDLKVRDIPVRRVVAEGIVALQGGRGICAIEESGALCISDSSWVRQHAQASYGDPKSQFRIPGDFVEVRQDDKKMCALSSDGAVLCRDWVRNRAPESRTSTSRVFPGSDIVQITSNTTLCAMHRGGQWDCPLADVEGTSGSFATATGSYDVNSHLIELVGITEDGALVGPTLGQIEGTFVELRTARGRICARRDDHSVFCNGILSPGIDSQHLLGVEHVSTIVYQSAMGDSRTGLQTDKGNVRPFGAVGGHWTIMREDVYGRWPAKTEQRKHVLNTAPKGVKFIEVQIGLDYGCGLQRRGKIRCWGSIRGARKPVRPPNGKFKELALGGHSAAALREDGLLLVWGSNPYQGPPPEGTFVSLRSTYLNHCAERADKTVSCWGPAFPTGFDVPFKPASYALLDAGVCAIRAVKGDVECFGTGFAW
ncbi:MAG: hypothetical protein JKY56_18435 [Kofleriaceae bacterium]|nr:hypothetical protein [Kofleriaceae bacterium]